MKIQRMRNFRLISAVLVVAMLQLTTGCASFPGHRIPEAGPSPKVENKPTVYVDGKFFTLIIGQYDTPMQNFEKGPQWIEIIRRCFDESNMFSRVTTTVSQAKDMDLTIRLDFTNSYNFTSAVVAGVISGLFLFSIPTWGKDTYRLDAAVCDNQGHTLKEYSYEDHVTTWFHMFLLPFIGSVKRVPERVIGNMTKYFFKELSTERALRSYFQKRPLEAKTEKDIAPDRPQTPQRPSTPIQEKIELRVVVPQAVIRLHPNPDSPVITPVPLGAKLNVKEKTESWYAVTFQKEGMTIEGYIHQDSVEVIKKSPDEISPR